MTPDLKKTRRLFGLFLLCSLLFNYPILGLFNLQRFVFGTPLLYVYLFSVWLVVIGLIAWTTRERQPSRHHTSGPVPSSSMTDSRGR